MTSTVESISNAKIIIVNKFSKIQQLKEIILE